MLPITPMTKPLNTEQPMIDALIALQTRITDTRIEFEKLLENAIPALRPTVQRFCDLHARHASAIAAMVAIKGYASDENGSIMGAVSRAVEAVRSYFNDEDADPMMAIRDSEQHVYAAFADAMAHPLPDDDIVKLTAMRDELVAMLGTARPST